MEEISVTCKSVRVWLELVQLLGGRVTLVKLKEFQVTGDAICCVSIVRLLRLISLCASAQAAGFRIDWMHEVFGMKLFQEGDWELIVWFCKKYWTNIL